MINDDILGMQTYIFLVICLCCLLCLLSFVFCLCLSFAFFFFLVSLFRMAYITIRLFGRSYAYAIRAAHEVPVYLHVNWLHDASFLREDFCGYVECFSIL